MRGRCKSHSKIQVAHKGQKKRSGITWMLAWFCDHAEVMYLKNASFFLRACCGNATGQIFWSTAPSHLSCDIFRGYLSVRLLLRYSERCILAALIIAALLSKIIGSESHSLKSTKIRCAPTTLEHSLVLKENSRKHQKAKFHVPTIHANPRGGSMLHLHELQVLCCVFVVERDREVVGKLACC